MSRSIRVVMLIQEYPPIIGGAERQLAAQASLLKNLGVEVHVVTRRWYSSLLPFEVVDGIQVHRMPSWGIRPVAAAIFIFSALIKISKLKPDLIHAHELLSPSTIAALAKRLFGIPVLVKILRGGIYGDISMISKNFFGRFRGSFIINSMDAFAVISEEIDNELRALGVEETRRIRIVNGVNSRHFAPVSTEEKVQLRNRLNLPDGKLAVFTGRLEPEKRVAMLVTNWPFVTKKVPDAHLVVIGAGSEDQRLRTMAGDQVHFIGPVQDVAPFLQAADIFVLPSVGEGLSNSILEAMSCGLPIVATSIGGTTDVIVHNENGLLIRPDSPDELNCALILLFGDDLLRARLAKTGRETILQRYALSEVVKLLYATYLTLIKTVH